jgi:ubiquinone/menaquinone biosynthesis C-methylase UbiE
MTTSFTHDSRQLAETYERVSDLQFDGGKRLVERLGLDQGARVLDIGCGTGRLTRWIGERLGPKGSAFGIDPLEERIGVARAQGGAARFEVGQAEDLSAFADASFDIVVMSSVFHWVADKAKALGEIRRVLRPGGRLGVTTSPQELSRAGTIALALQPLLRSAPYAGHADLSALSSGSRCTSTDFVTLVLESGLELVELHVTQRESHHESGEAVLDFVVASSFGNFLRIVPEQLRASFRADLISEFDRQRGPDGVVVRGWGLLFVATRT